MEQLDKKLITISKKLQESPNPVSLIQESMDSGKLSKNDLLQMLECNHNLVSNDVINECIKKEFFTKDDLETCGIDSDFIDLLSQEKPIDPALGSDYQPIESINPGSTEVYFWGMPGSGKSCALGAVLSIANNGGDKMIQQPCQGGDYMTRLSGLFRYDGDHTFLPSGTDVKNTYEMRFSIIRDQKEHPLSLIDFSGELFRCLYKQHTNIVLTDDEKPALETLTNLLKEHASENRKIHFFVVEYGAEDRKLDGLPQGDYLQRAAEHLNNIGVFDQYTDAVYIILTKADKAGEFDSREDEDNHYLNYMSKHYSGFYRALKHMCEKHSINGGKLEFVPFSIGEVCFKNFCCFDSASAREILDYIVERSFYVERDFFGRIKRVLSK